ncbi:Fe-S oxidoreductase [Amnibacterium endophyticum]|uniref:Fe-S oxidoreductase n=1 Tax=Amnibacterium endophyticum TaxID=2109337 RepID=A0ABW4LHQ4_9MICO
MHRWITRAGYLVATAFALAWALPLSRGRVRREAGLVVLTGLPRWAFGRGGTTVGGVYLTASNDSPAVLRHEAVHRQQWLRHGLTMPIRYALAGRDPARNRYEVEAGLEDGGYAAG